MINGKIDKELRKLTDYEPGKVKYKNEATFNKIVSIYKMIDGLNITISQEFKDELIDKKKPELGKKPKDNLTLRITYGNGTGKRTFFYDTEREREREEQQTIIK